VASRDTLARSDALWKPFAIQLYPELALRADDTDWRACLLRKRSVQRETPQSICSAFIQRGENIWRSKNQWFKCECGLLYFIGECARPMERARCNECGRNIGGRDHLMHDGNPRGARNLTHEEADAYFGSSRSGISNMQVNVRRLSGDVWTTMHVPRDCTVVEAKWRITRQHGIPAARQSLVFGDETLADDCVFATVAGESTSLDLMLLLSQ